MACSIPSSFMANQRIRTVLPTPHIPGSPSWEPTSLQKATVSFIFTLFSKSYY